MVNGAKWYNKGMHGNSEHTCTASIYDMSPCQLMIPHVINEFMFTMYKPVKQVLYNLIMGKKILHEVRKRGISNTYVTFHFHVHIKLLGFCKSMVTW